MLRRILIALSGGVDSAVAAALLKQSGHELIGVTMQICPCEPATVSTALRRGCYGVWKGNDIDDARRVAQHLAIPFHIIDLCHEYERDVLDEVVLGYSHGRTPNPCVYCNSRIKFGALIDSAQKAGLQFDFIATGHYANIEYDVACGRFLLKKGADAQKDQSYFLSFLNQKQLGVALFPLGSYSKSQVRRMAAELGLPVSDKVESQDFVSGGYQTLLHGEEQQGPILDGQGRKIGVHNGIARYTIGQRKGLNVSTCEKLYVTKILPDTNTIVVGTEIDLEEREFQVSCLNWIAVDRLSCATRAEIKIRSKAELAMASVNPLDDSVSVVFDVPQKCITPGQAAVFYHDTVVLGAGIIDVVPVP